MINFLKVTTIFFLIFHFNKSIAENYEVDQKVTNQFTLNHKFKIDLPDGEWVVAEKPSYEFYGLWVEGYTLLRIENDKVVEGISIGEFKTEGKYKDSGIASEDTNALNQAIYQIVFKNKYDGCYERPEYSVLKFYAKGTTHNCFRVGHQDLIKEIYNPDDPWLRNANTQLKAWLKNKSIELPKISLNSSHSYFSRLVGGKWFYLDYFIDPKILNAPTNKFLTKESSEYHKDNITNYPEHEKIMQKWISISAERHVNFEKSISALKRHLLGLS